MSWTPNSRIGYSSGSYRTYGGAGQFVTRPVPTAEYIRRLKLPDASGVLLATITASKRLAGGENVEVPQTVRGAYQYCRRYAVPARPASVQLYGGPDFQELDPADPFTVAQAGDLLFGWWAWQESTSTIIVVPPKRSDVTGASIPVTDGIYFARFAIPCSTKPKTFRDTYWEPRLLSAPNVSLRIEEAFGGIAQIGGGKMTMANADGFFDAYEGCAWDEGIVTLEYGLDLPHDADGTMDEADYMPVGIWRVESSERTDTLFTLSLKELKTRAEASIPVDLFTREEFPGLNNDQIGKPIPFAYGYIYSAKAIILDRTRRNFKVAAHRIRSFDGVKIKQSQKVASDVIITSWLSYSSDVWSSVFNDTILNVNFGATELTEKKSIASVDATAGSWYQDGGILYVRPPGSQVITDDTVTVRREQTFTVWVQSSFATIDVARAEFTLGDDWNRSDDVACDFQGRLKYDGGVIENWADVVLDLLDYLGETQFDLESFNRSRQILALGVDRYGFEATHLAASLYIDSAKKAREVLSDICKVVGAYLFVDAQGAWRFQVFDPVMSKDLSNSPGHPPRTFDETDLLEPLVKSEDNRKVFSRVVINYAERHAEEYSDNITETRPLNRYLHGRNEIEDEVRAAPLRRREDAIAYAQSLLTTEGQGIVTYKNRLPRAALLLDPGDQILLTHERYGLNQVMEALSVDKDFLTGRVSVTLGDRRGWQDTFGWWAIEEMANVAPSVPADVALWLKHEGLAGYLNNESVYQWADLSGNARHFSQFFPSRQPVLRTNQINGLPALRFDIRYGASGFSLGSAGFAAAFSAAEIFAVVKMDADPPSSDDSGPCLWNVSTPGVNRIIAADGTVKETFGTSAQKNTAVNPAPSFTSWRCYNVITASGEYTINLDGTQIYTTATNTVQFNGSSVNYLLGGNYTDHPFIGDVAEIVMFNRKLTTPERDGVIAYLSTRLNLGLIADLPGPLPWDANWTDAEVADARQNHAYWHDDEDLAAAHSPTGFFVAAIPGDRRSYQTGRWW